MKKFIYIFLLFLVSGAYSQYSPIRNKRNFIKESFESSDFLNSFQTADDCCVWSLNRSDSFAHTGNNSLRVEWRTGDDAGGFRSEIVGWTEPTMFCEREYEFWYYIPANRYTIDPIYKVVFQEHESPDFIWGEDYRSPPLALHITNNQWQVVVRWDKDSVNTNGDLDGSQTYTIGTVQTDTWIKWKFKIKHAYDTTGQLQVWKDDVQVVNRLNSPNYYNDRIGPYPKWGIYNPAANDPSSTANLVVLYIDDIRIGSNSGRKLIEFKSK